MSLVLAHQEVSRRQKRTRCLFVLLEDDYLITHAGVTSDILLEDVPDVPVDEAVRLVIDVTVRPYRVGYDSVNFV